MSEALLPVKLLRVTTVAERWDVSKQSVHNLIRSGKLRWSRPFGQFCGLDKLYPVVVMPPF